MDDAHSVGHDYLKARITQSEEEFDIPEGSEGIAACLARLGDATIANDLKHGARVLALVQILHEAGLTTFGKFVTLSKEIESRLITQAERGNPDASH